MSEHSTTLCALEKRISDLELRFTLPQLMTASEVCEFLQFSESQFYALKRKGEAPPAIYWSERSVRYDRDAVIAWAKRKEVGQV